MSEKMANTEIDEVSRLERERDSLRVAYNRLVEEITAKPHLYRVYRKQNPQEFEEIAAHNWWEAKQKSRLYCTVNWFEIKADFIAPEGWDATLLFRLTAAERERDSLKRQLAEANAEVDLNIELMRKQNAECAEIREALEHFLVGAKHMSCCYEPEDPDPTWHCCNWSEVVEQGQAVLSSTDAGKDLLERLEKAESIIKRTAQHRHRLIRNAACKQCKEFPCEGDDRVLCIHKNLMTDIDAYLKAGGEGA